jgi:acid-sensing ion channel 5
MQTIEHIVGSAEPKDLIEQRRKSIILDYLLAASTHGLRSVGRAYSKTNRIFWAFTFAVAFGCMLYFVTSSILQYYTYPTQTSVDIRLDRNMTFPAVTICSGNPFRYDTLNTSLISYFYRLVPPNTPFNQTVLNSLVIPLIVDLFSRNQTSELVSIGFQLSDYLLQCTYNGINCSNVFTASISPAMGNCFTFNWKALGNVFTISDYGDTLLIREGLSMSFYIPQELFFPTTLYDVGLVVTLHDNDELPIPTETGLYLQPGASHLITYQKSETSFLPAPYTNCTSDITDDLRALYASTFLDPTASNDVTYSDDLCLELCLQAYIFSQCSCILPLPFYARKVLTIGGVSVSADFCNTFTAQTSCAFSAKQQLFADAQLLTLWCSRCVSQCTHTDFQTDLSAQLAPSEGDREYWSALLLSGQYNTSVLFPSDLAQRFDYYLNRNYLKLQVTCGSKYTIEYNQEAKLTLIDTFAAIGGQTGL